MQKTEIDAGARAEFLELEFLEPIIEPSQASELGIDGEPRVLVDAAIVFVETEGSRLKWAGREITADVFIRDDVELRVRF